MCWEQNASWRSNAVIFTLNTPLWLARIMQKIFFKKVRPGESNPENIVHPCFKETSCVNLLTYFFHKQYRTDYPDRTDSYKRDQPSCVILVFFLKV